MDGLTIIALASVVPLVIGAAVIVLAGLIEPGQPGPIDGQVRDI